ncbi:MULTISPECIES: RNA polymerase sigma factor [Faecalicatena]|nr:RNA polymerase sigma factor [Faecalicatena sp.]MCI6463931.1 RNA polymerase sigma factor [Faecalicatena sp.]MDY5620831.1 RNA polymerase sigma factor [Lachnospiraceae bacterium]
MFTGLEEDYEKIYRYCYMKLKHQQTAEDITQETFLCFLENCTYKEIGRRLPFLYTIARNKCIDQYRAKKTEGLSDNVADSKDRSPEVSIDLERAVVKLNSEERELIFLRYVNEVPVNDISKILNISRFSVRRRIQNCLKKLKDTLGEDF